MGANKIAGGYHGRYLRVDLTLAESEFISLDESVLRRFLGGSGLGAYLLLKEQSAEVDPLSAEASLAVVFSPLVGSPLTTSAKFAVVSKSPLTQRINDSLASSGFAISGKKAGCDAIVVTGRAAQPSILIIDDGKTHLEPAGEIWGTTCNEAELLLRDRLGEDFRFAVIGPAGENLVRYATISHDGRHAGRGGSGTVLGSKNIKAIAVRGTQTCRWANGEKLVSLAKELSKKSFGPATAKYRELGTASNLLVMNRLGALPTRNFQRGTFAGANQIAPETLTVTRNKTRASCAACTIGCEHIYSLSPDSEDSDSPGVRLEYENLFALGPLCDINDGDVVLKASRRCDELGLDTISTGGTIAFAMECVERGFLNADWLRFGSGDALLQAIEMIGRSSDLGKQMAKGSRQMALEIGHDTISFAPQVKGLEIPGYEPRALQTMALGFAVGTRGADHNRSGAYEVDFSEKIDRRNPEPAAVLMAVETEDKAALMDSLILCKFLRGTLKDFFAESAEMLQFVTGWQITADELRQTAKRIVTAKKLLNIRAGWKTDEDTLPARLLQQELPEDTRASLSQDKLTSMIVEYNRLRDWTSEGEIPNSILEKLDLHSI